VKRIAIAVCVVGAVTAVTGAAAGGAATTADSRTHAGGSLCVSNKPACYSTIQAAVDAAHDGDTIAIAPGRYAGGVTVDVSVSIVGAGPASTTIKGGGPVLTLGVFGAATEPTVSITGVTITGGVATSTPTPSGPLSFVAAGGGVYIPGSATGAGAIVTIRNSVITGNRATPVSTIDSGEPCGSANCLFAQALGAGIADVGRLTLINTTVSNNVAGGPLASDAAGGGIWTATNGGAGALTLVNSTVTGNSAAVAAPNGRIAEGGGIHVQDGEAFSLSGSVVSNNTSSLSSSYPSGVFIEANTGGIHIGGSGSATITSSRITGNTASANDPASEPGAFASALGVGFSDCVCGQTLVLKDSVINGNHTSATGGGSTLAASAVEIDTSATISNSAISGNTISGSGTGAVVVGGALFAFDSEAQPIVVRNSAVAGNVLEGSSSGGPVNAGGAGINNGGSLELHNVLVSNNSASATAPSGSVHGGGIWNGMPFAPDGPTPHLTLENTLVTRNALSASPGLEVQGAGLYTPGFPISRTNSLIAHNAPDQCFGC
jgi:fibronectin-binding autotransporter adhesin